MFTMIFATSDDLILGYKDIRDHVAISFQSQELENSAERWNLYIFYLVAGHVSHDQKQLIEHDKFSTRKIVCSSIGGEITDDVVSGLIEAELFDFKVEKRKPAATNLEALLIRDFPNVAAALNALGSADTVAALEQLLNYLSNGQDQPNRNK